MKSLVKLTLLMLAVAFLVAASADTIVYITRTGECYHRGSCHHLRRSKIEVTLGEAVRRGYRPCKNCSPPTLDWKEPKQEKPKPKAEPEEVVKLYSVSVLEITDGDTLVAERDEKEFSVRLIGIDTPEVHQKVDGKWKRDPEPYAEEATGFLGKILKERSVWLEYDVQHEDKYDRVLAYVWAKGSDDEAKILVNAQMLRQGLAVLMTIPPNVKYVERFKKAQAAAKKEKLNLWSE